MRAGRVDEALDAVAGAPSAGRGTGTVVGEVGDRPVVGLGPVVGARERLGVDGRRLGDALHGRGGVEGAHVVEVHGPADARRVREGVTGLGEVHALPDRHGVLVGERREILGEVDDRGDGDLRRAEEVGEVSGGERAGGALDAGDAEDGARPVPESAGAGGAEGGLVQVDVEDGPRPQREQGGVVEAGEDVLGDGDRARQVLLVGVGVGVGALGLLPGGLVQLVGVRGAGAGLVEVLVGGGLGGGCWRRPTPGRGRPGTRPGRDP